ncbi:protein SRC2 homolog [Diospyros lotus]|uniref:protein SRC2 homolog n=1 Tax=Diospyros lotus TaxID=55363 RepID=UPI00225A7F81|nr:protein SRC2 homolog [Diospyros lotus]
MASGYEVEVTITSAKDLKNVNWRHGPLRPYAVAWVDPKSKCSTNVDKERDTCPYWNHSLVIPLDAPIEDSTLFIDIVQADAAEDTKPLIGSARLRLREVVDEAGLGRRAPRKLELKRPSGRPHGKLEVEVSVRGPPYRAPDPYYAPPYGVPPASSRDYYAAPPSYGGNPYAAPPASGNPYASPYQAAPPSGYPYAAAPPYGQPSGGYGQEYYGQPPKEEKKSKYGLGTGLAVGAVAGVLGGLVIGEAAEAVEDKIADDAAERVEDDFANDDGGFDGDDF